MTGSDLNGPPVTARQARWVSVAPAAVIVALNMGRVAGVFGPSTWLPTVTAALALFYIAAVVTGAFAQHHH